MFPEHWSKLFTMELIKQQRYAPTSGNLVKENIIMINEIRLF